MTKKGDFYSAMFIVLAVGCFLIYGWLGYTTNAIAQVCALPFTTIGILFFRFNSDCCNRRYLTNFDAKA